VRKIGLSIAIVIAAALFFQPAALSAASFATNAKLLSDRLFAGGQKLRVSSTAALPQWAPVRRFMLDSHSVFQPDMLRWVQWSRTLRKLPVHKKLAIINARVNEKFDYVSDVVLWHKKDYWENPVEAINRGGIDCEGFAIFKMYMAFLAGIPLKDMAILLGWVPDGDAIHAVLAVTDGTRTYLLDNRQAPVVPAADFEDIDPVAAIAMDEIWVFPKNLR
jgi:predicted transglutaminase-like cysteine proteinase